MTGEAAAVQSAIRAERERIRLALLGCVKCGKIHERRQDTCTCGKPTAHGAFTWASADDGHAYNPAYSGRDIGELIRAVIP